MHVTCVVLYCKGHGAKHKKKIARNMSVRKEARQGLKKKRAAAWSKDILKHKMTERDQEKAGDKRSAARSIRNEDFFSSLEEKNSFCEIIHTLTHCALKRLLLDVLMLSIIPKRREIIQPR